MQSVGNASHLFEMRVDNEHPTVLSADDLIEAWAETVPDLAARALDLRVGATVIVFETPDVTVTRIS